MRIPALPSALALIASAAPALAAQASDALYTRFSALTGLEVRVYDFDDPLVAPRTSQWRVPVIAVVPLGHRASLDLTASYASTRLATGETLDGPTDTQLRTLYTVSRDRVVASLSVNLPTGSYDLTGDEFIAAAAVGSNYLSFPVPSVGNGFSATGGLAWVTPLGSWNLGVSGSLRYQGSYTPAVEGTSTQKYDPGSEVRLRGGVDRLLGERTRVTAGLTFSTFSSDQFTGTGQFSTGRYKPGPRVIGEFALARAIGRTALTLVVWDFYRTAGETTDTSAATSDSTDALTQENVFNAELRWSLPASRRVQVEPLVGYRQYDLKQFQAGQMYSGAVTARIGLSDRLSASVTGRYDGGWVARATGGRSDLTGFGLTAFLRYTR